MKCMSCSEEVSSKFAHAIKSNACPYCGDTILSPKLQVILADLKAALEDAKEFPAEVEDFLLSNYSLKKFDPDQEVMAHTRSPAPTFDEQGRLINPKPGSKPISVNRSDGSGTQSENQEGITDFAKRAGVKSLKRVIDDIQGQGAADPNEFGADPEGGMIDDSNVAPLDQRGANELQNVFETSNPVLELEKLKRLRLQGQIDSKIRRE